MSRAQGPGEYVALIPGAYGFTSAYADAEFNRLARKVLRLSVALFAATVAINGLSVVAHLVVILGSDAPGQYAVFLAVSSFFSLLAVAISGLIAWCGVSGVRRGNPACCGACCSRLQCYCSWNLACAGLTLFGLLLALGGLMAGGAPPDDDAAAAADDEGEAELTRAPTPAPTDAGAPPALEWVRAVNLAFNLIFMAIYSLAAWSSQKLLEKHLLARLGGPRGEDAPGGAAAARGAGGDAAGGAIEMPSLDAVGRPVARAAPADAARELAVPDDAHIAHV